MKPYMIIEGNNQAIEHFEKKVADALEQGYSLAGELVSHAASNPNEIKFYQTVIMTEDEDEDDDEDYEDEDEEDDD